MSLIYLASPYSKYPHGREQAFRQVCRKAGELMLKGEKVFCPIAHSHPIEYWGMQKDQEGDFWLNQDFSVLEHCSKLIVYKMEGWEDSYGVKKEIEFAQQLDIPIEYHEQ